MNDLMDRVSTYPFLPVYTVVICAKGEVLLITKSNAVGLGIVGVRKSLDGSLLFIHGELRKTCEEKYNKLGQGDRTW